MKANCLLLFFIVSTLFSCHKGTTDPGEPHDVPPNADSFVALKLKDINFGSLPSPYYHFDYSDDKHLSRFNFGYGLLYNISYRGDDLTLMKNNTAGTSKDSIKYNYTNDRVTSIDITTDSGLLYHRAFLTYSLSGQLQTLEWELKQANQPFAKEQSFTFTYYPDGNVKEVTQHYFAIGSFPETTFTDKYENYDDKKNVDGFTLVHTSSNQYKHPILLPGITWQVNNARRVIRTGGAAVNFEVNNTYTYDSDGRPVTKTADFLFTSGSNSGHHSAEQTTYNYYN